MSELQRAYGFISVLKTPIDTSNNEYIPMCDDPKCLLNLTYDGKSVYMDLSGDNCYEPTFTRVGYSNDKNIDKYAEELFRYDIAIVPETTRPFYCVWYNGSDCPIDKLTSEQIINGYYDE